jgi:hypothetical protein
MEKTSASSHNFIHLFFQPSESEPVTFRVNLAQLSQIATVVFVMFLVLFWGTLLFFRQLEINRDLQAEILSTQLKLQLKTSSLTTEPTWNRQIGYKVQLSEDLGNRNSELKQNNKVLSSDSSLQNDSWLELSHSMVSARLGSFSSECQLDNCSVKLELLPAGNGLAEGELLLVLETEVPRIGSRGLTSQQRKQFIVYPGYFSKDELSLSEISGFEKRSFKFSRTLNASVNFKTTKFLRPLALNIFLFDERKTLVRHERRAIELDENYAN